MRAAAASEEAAPAEIGAQRQIRSDPPMEDRRAAAATRTGAI